MTVLLNGQSFDIISNNVLEFLSENGYANLDGCAVALNDSVVPKSELSNAVLQNHDKVLVITATQGG